MRNFFKATSTSSSMCSTVEPFFEKQFHIKAFSFTHFNPIRDKRDEC